LIDLFNCYTLSGKKVTCLSLVNELVSVGLWGGATGGYMVGDAHGA
jgi:hypothetical protein